MKSKAIFGLFALAVVSLGLANAEQPAYAAPQEKVVICHSRQPQPSNGQGAGAQNNPYGPSAIEVNVNSIIGNNGHEEHDGPIFNNTNQDFWGDIIPRFEYMVRGEVKVYPGMNIDAGQAWLDNDCQQPGSNPFDICDPSQKPSGSIADWLANTNFEAVDCFEYKETNVCGQFNVEFTRNDTPYDYEFRYVIGSTTPSLANWEGDGALPVSFDEDEYDGLVDVTYYVVGEEADYFKGFGIPNIWDGNGVTVEVDTDCKRPEGGSGGYTPEEPENPETPVTPAETETPVVSMLPNTFGASTPVVAAAALSLVGIIVVAGTVIKSRLLS